MKLVSIAMCTYNGDKYLAQQLDSLIGQSYSNLEIIIVDDCSTDRTIEILNKYQQKDERIKIFQNPNNLGFVQNFAKAISLCTGDYIALADQDDVWKLNKIEKFLKEIGENLLIYSDAITMDEEGQVKNEFYIRPRLNLVSGRCNKAFLTSNCASGNTMMFKKELLAYILPIPEVSYHDIWIAFVASTVGSITFTEEAMIYYRRHSEQVTKDKKKVRERSFTTRFQRKLNQKKLSAKTLLRDYKAYRSLLDKVSDPEVTIVLDALIAHYENYEKIIINFALKKVLFAYLDEIYAILPKSTRRTSAKKVLRGLKYYQLTFFI